VCVRGCVYDTGLAPVGVGVGVGVRVLVCVCVCVGVYDTGLAYVNY